MKLQTILNLGIYKTAISGLGYFYAQAFKRANEESLEDFLINRFGSPLYKMFFEDYTEKVWGIHPRKISSSWGAQRIKGLSLMKAVIQALKSINPLKKKKDIRQKNIETSLIEHFMYPKFGPGQMWEIVSADIEKMGGVIIKNQKVTEIEISDSKIISVSCETENGSQKYPLDYCISRNVSHRDLKPENLLFD